MIIATSILTHKSRLLLDVTIPHGPFNTAVRDGTAGATISRILEDIKPEAVYFTERDGHRGASLVVRSWERSEDRLQCTRRPALRGRR